MVQGPNKGHRYEDGIAQKLLERKIVVKQVCPNHKYAFDYKKKEQNNESISSWVSN